MQTSVNLQNLYTYSSVPLIFSVLLLCFILICYFKNKKMDYSEIKPNEMFFKKNKNSINKYSIKDKYLRKLDSIEKKYKNNEINLRLAYQQISECIRMFVFEITGIKTQNYTLSELKKLKIPHLYELVEEFYEYEFSLKSEGDFDNSINKARRVIQKWN